jgi:hypothetical protein
LRTIKWVNLTLGEKLPDDLDLTDKTQILSISESKKKVRQLEARIFLMKNLMENSQSGIGSNQKRKNKNV